MSILDQKNKADIEEPPILRELARFHKNQNLWKALILLVEAEEC